MSSEMDGTNHSKDILSEAKQTEKVSKLGRENGLFKQCMDEIKSSHSKGQALRSASLAAGAVSDVHVYAELLCQFYVATEALERRIDDFLDSDQKTIASNDGSNNNGTDNRSILQQVNSLDYRFSKGYERDLEFLLGSNWRCQVESMTTDPARDYIQRLKIADEIGLTAAAFILWGPLVIGGGAAIRPRVKKSFGEGATNVFNDVVGNAKGGKSERRRKFIDVYDSLLDHEGDKDVEKEKLEAIVNMAGEFMLLNNAMMLAVKKSPWWSKYVWAGVISIFAAGAFRLLPTGKRAN